MHSLDANPPVARSGARRRILLVSVLVGLLALLVSLMPQEARGQAAEDYHVDGLSSAVEINIDEWGVPHIFANSTDDVFLAQGWQVARDRLFQIDLWRRRGLGELSAAFGPNYIAQDRAARLFLYHGDMQDEWDAYGPDSNAEQIATQFAAGINAYIDWLEENPEALPPEFKMLDYWPARWSPEDVVRNRTHGLTRGVADEVSLARGLACQGRLDLNPLAYRYEPNHTTEVPEGLDPCSIPANVLTEWNLARASANLSGLPTQPIVFELPEDQGFEEGSNNWTISPQRTTTGRPILANDPHRAHQSPSLRYISHLSTPELDVIGAGEPALPGISIGHNGTVAFGLTIFAIDEADLYVYELNELNTHYWYDGEWEAFEVIETEIEVRDAPRAVRAILDAAGVPRLSVPRDLVFTRHGPVTLIDEANNRAYAVRTTWTEPGTAPYFGSVAYMTAQNWDEFHDAMSRWGTPGENQVYADVAGNIGWQPGGVAPVRPNWDGLLPVPGDGRYEWDGFRNVSEFPTAFNPEDGFFATANQFNAQPDSQFGYRWSDRARFNRVYEALAENDHHSLQDSKDLQNDVINTRSRRFSEMVAELSSHDPLTAEAIELMTGYDGDESLGPNPQARLYRSYWNGRIRDAVKAELVAPADRGLFGAVDWLVVEDALENPEEWFDGGVETRDQILLSSLRSAFVAARNALGTDPSQWPFNGVNRSWNHPLGNQHQEPSFNRGPVRKPGSGDVPIASAAASFKMVLDVGEWDNSFALNVPGQSGVPGTKHYDNLVERWANDDYFPLLYSRSAINKHTDQRIILTPSGRTG